MSTTVTLSLLQRLKRPYQCYYMPLSIVNISRTGKKIALSMKYHVFFTLCLYLMNIKVPEYE